MSKANPDYDVVIIDPDPVALTATRIALEVAFGPVTALTDAAEATKRLKRGVTYKAIVLDVTEPTTGLAVLRLARERDPQAQVVLQAADPSAATAVQAMQMGAANFLFKPIKDSKLLIGAVRRAVHDWELRRNNTHVLAEIKERNAELDRTVDLFRHLNQSVEMMHTARDPKQVLNILLRSASQFLEAQRVSIMIRNPKNGEMAIQVAEGLDEAVIREVKVRDDEGVAGQVLTSKRPVVVNDINDAPAAKRAPRVRAYKGRAYMSVPLVMNGKEGVEKVIGVVNVTDRATDRPFSPNEVEFVTFLARQAAIALTGAAVWQSIAHHLTAD